MKRLLGVALFLMAMVMASSLVEAEPFGHTLTDGPMTFSWVLADGAIECTLTGKTKGWVAVGFNPVKMMKGANFIMGYVKGGKVKVTDHIGNSERSHKADTKSGGKNSAVATGGTEKGGVTEIHFTIPLDSKDPSDTAIDAKGMTTVLLAMGARDSFRAVHSFRSIHRVNLTTGVSKKVK